MNSCFALFTFVAVAAPITAFGQAGASFDFNRVKPLLESTCVSCHGPKDQKGKLRLDTKTDTLKGGEAKGTSIVSGQPEKSPLYTLTVLPPDHDDIMPPKGAPLTKEQTELLRQWIVQGAPWPDNVTLGQVPRVDFVKDIQPILEFNCVSCHREGSAKGGLRLDNKSDAFKSGDHGPRIIPGDASKSTVHTSTTLPKDDDALMPPANKGGPLPKDKIELLRNWTDQGASWPNGIVLTSKKAEEAPDVKFAETVEQIHKRILANLNVTDEKQMAAYKNMIPGSDLTYEMVPIPGGRFTMGSPPNERGRKADEGPPAKVEISPFWMGKYEVTWNEYEMFMFPLEEKKLRAYRGTNAELDAITDAVTRPTTPYVEMSFGMGKDGYPAISMTQHAANSFCKWLSAKTGHFYRLPTEAEWEYACRAGTTTRWSFGDDPEQLPPGTPTALVKELSGTAEFQKAGTGEWLPATVGQSLQARDKFRTKEKSKALIQFAYLAPANVSENSTNEIRPPDYLGEYAWYSKNSDFKYQKVGRKKPNPWGLYDMHGNVAEWTLDQSSPEGYKQFAGAIVKDPWSKATTPYPHAVRGGSWDDDPDRLRSAARRFSDKNWKIQDPQLPKSIWFHTDAQFLGFRVVRPLKVPSAEECSQYWTSGVEKE